VREIRPLRSLFSLSFSLSLSLARASSLLFRAFSPIRDPREDGVGVECVRSPIDRKVCILARERQGERKRDTRSRIRSRVRRVASRRLASPRVALDAQRAASVEVLVEFVFTNTISRVR